jgi:hypothetical protein
VEVCRHRRGRPDNDIPGAVVGLLPEEGAGGVPCDNGQHEQEGQHDASTDEEKALSELLRVIRHGYGAKVWWVSRAGKAV